MNGAIAKRLAAALSPGDDGALWQLVVADVVAEADRVFTGLATPPRHAVLTFARVPQRHPELHPDDAAQWRLSWTRERGDDRWQPAGALPRLRRRRGHFWACVCVPAGSRRLAAVEVTVLWRPRAPWAAPDETEIGREVRTYLRDAHGTWRARGVRES